MNEESPQEEASLEALVENGMLALDSLHPGGLALTAELATLCGIDDGKHVLDVASGTGETACFLAEALGARVTGVDYAEEMVERARRKAGERGLDIEFRQADAIRLPFDDEAFDAVICECTLCFLDKPAALGEMKRLVRSGGKVGMHDLCWREDVPERVRGALARIEGERPETLDGWQRLFRDAGLVEVEAVDKYDVKSQWMKDSRRALGLVGQVGLGVGVIRRWGLRGLWRVLRSQQVFSSRFLGYGIVVGTKP